MNKAYATYEYIKGRKGFYIELTINGEWAGAWISPSKDIGYSEADMRSNWKGARLESFRKAA